MYKPGELRTAATDRLLVGFEKFLPDGGISERLADLTIEALNNRGRRAGWNEQPTHWSKTIPLMPAS